MLPKKHKLPSKDIKGLAFRGQKYSGDFLTIRVVPSTKTRIAISVSKKSIKLAVDRNRTKRIISSWIINNIDLIPESDLLVLVTKKLDKDVRNLEEQIISDLNSIIKKIREA